MPASSDAAAMHAARLERALTERIYLVGALPPTSHASFLVSGQTGRVYTASLPIAPSRDAPRCNCIDQRIRKGACKHLLFLCLRVFKLPRASLKEPRVPADVAARVAAAGGDAALAAAGAHAAPALLRAAFQDAAAAALPAQKREAVEAREPAQGDECAICYEALLPEPLAYCVFGCGQAVHAECFERYENSTREEARCVLCRVEWRVKEGGKPVGRGGLLVGRRVVDLSREVPFMYEGVTRARVVAQTKARRERVHTKGKKGSAQTKGQRARKGKQQPFAEDKVSKPRSGRATAEARAAAVSARKAAHGEGNRQPAAKVTRLTRRTRVTAHKAGGSK